MNKKIGLGLLFAALIGFYFLSGCATPQKATSNEVQMRSSRQIILSNGLPVYIVEDKNLPYVTYSMLIRSGSAHDPAQKAGLASLTARLLDKGAAKQTAIQLADQIAFYGGEVSTDTEKDFTQIRISSLSQYKAEVLKMFANIVTRPDFPAGEFNREKQKSLAQLKQLVDSPSDFTETQFLSYLYGDHPYGHIPMGGVPSLQSLKREDVLQFYREHYQPKGAILAVVGQVGEEDIKSLESVFGAWQNTQQVDKGLPAPKKPEGFQIRLVHKPDLKQTQVIFGHLGIRREDPDFIQVRMANAILGGGFSSRLMSRIRVQLGLTYGINSSVDTGLVEGPFVVSSFTRHEKIGEMIRETRSLLAEFAQKGVGQKELDSVKGYLKGVFPMTLETAEAYAFNLLLLRHYNIPESYLQTYLSEVDRTTLAQINAVIRKKFDPNNMRVLVFSDQAQTLEQLRQQAVVEVVDYKTLK